MSKQQRKPLQPHCRGTENVRSCQTPRILPTHTHTHLHPTVSPDSVIPKGKHSTTLIGQPPSLTQLAPDRLPPTSLGETGNRHLFCCQRS